MNRVEIIFVYHFVDSGIAVIFKNEWVAEKKGAFILKYGIEPPLHTCISGWRNFHAESGWFSLFVYGNEE